MIAKFISITYDLFNLSLKSVCGICTVILLSGMVFCSKLVVSVLWNSNFLYSSVISLFWDVIILLQLV